MNATRAPATRALVGAGLLATGVWVAMSAARPSHEERYADPVM